MGCTIMMKDHSRDHMVARDSIRANLDLIVRYTIEVQHNIGELQELLTLISWYLDAEMTKIDKHYNDAPLDHLRAVSNEYSDYCNDLVKMETTIRQLIFVINKRFNVESPEMLCISKKANGSK